MDRAQDFTSVTQIAAYEKNGRLERRLKVLGVTLDRTLPFHRHFLAVKESCTNHANLIRSISSKWTPSDRAMRHRRTDVVICSRIFYGIEIPSRVKDNQVKTLAPTYNTIRAISGMLPSTPADSACAEAGVLPKAALTLGNRTVSYLERIKEDGQICFLEENGNSAPTSVANIQIPPLARLHRNRH